MRIRMGYELLQQDGVIQPVWAERAGAVVVEGRAPGRRRVLSDRKGEFQEGVDRRLGERGHERLKCRDLFNHAGEIAVRVAQEAPARRGLRLPGESPDF